MNNIRHADDLVLTIGTNRVSASLHRTVSNGNCLRSLPLMNSMMTVTLLKQPRYVTMYLHLIQHTLKALFVCNISSVIFSVMQLFVKLLPYHLPYSRYSNGVFCCMV